MLNQSGNPSIADVQSTADGRNIAIDEVGIKGLNHPVSVASRDGAQRSVASVCMYVGLAAEHRGTHMSRFIEALNEQNHALCLASVGELLQRLITRLDAQRGGVEFTFPFFLEKSAPVSGARSVMDYRVTLGGEISPDGLRLRLTVVVPITSLCPCSKEISDYGAHNQRSEVVLEVETHAGDAGSAAGISADICIEELITLVEAQGSSELYGILKRADEKFVTEAAYDQPKFVEDIIRDIAVACNRDRRIARYRISVENFESIHNHSAYARIVGDTNSEQKLR